MSLVTYLIAGVSAAVTFYASAYFVAQGYVSELGLSSDYSQFEFALGKWGWISVVIVFFSCKNLFKSKSSLPAVVSGTIAGGLLTLSYIISEISWLQFNVLETQWYFWTAWLAAIVSGISAVVFDKSL